MAAPYFGGFAITDAIREGPFSLRVIFTSTYSTTYQHQVYVNRTLAGVTDTTADREVMCTCQPADWPPEIQLAAVDPSESGTDYGSLLPDRCYNQIKITFTTVGWTDATRIEVTAGAAAGDVVDDENVIARALFDTNREYEILTDPREGSGTHYIEVKGVDDTKPDGNPGTVIADSVHLDVIPPDFTLQADGTRFGMVAVSGTLTLSYTEAI